MAKPITWRTIAGPSFNNSALATAVGAFDRAGSGFGEVSDRLMDTQDRIDQQYTNQAIKQALATGQVDPSLNPRADSTAVYEALLGKQKAESDLQTAEAGRAETVANTAGIQADTAAQEYLNTPEMREFDRQLKEAQIARAQAQTENERRAASIREQELKQQIAEYQNGIKVKTDTDAIDSQFYKLEEDIVNRLIQERHPGRAQLTPEELRKVTMDAEAEARLPENLRIIEGWARANKLSSDAYNASAPGQVEIAALQSAQAVSERRLEALDNAADIEAEHNIRAADGDFSLSVWDEENNNYGAAKSKDQVTRETNAISSDSKASAHLRNNGILLPRDDKMTDQQKRIIAQVRNQFPTSSMFRGIIKGFRKTNARGKFTKEVNWDALEESVALGFPEAMLQEAQRRANTPISSGTLLSTQRVSQPGRPQRTAQDIIADRQSRSRGIRGGPNRGSQ